MINDITYRRAMLSDSKKLSILYKQVYIQTYGTEGVSDEYANFIVEHFSIERIERTLSANSDTMYVAEYKNNLVGVAEIEFGKRCSIGDFVAPELHKLYILERFCGIGVGHRLLSHTEEVIQLKGEKQLWLWVWDENERAIAFYQRQGYKAIGKAPFQMETNLYHNIVMVKQLW